MKDEREEGEISLDDVSSSDDATYSASLDRRSHRTRLHSTRDTIHGKENRHYLREAYTSQYTFPTLHEKNDLYAISSDESLEIVEIPNTSHHLRIRVPHKTRRKKTNYKKPGSGMTLDTYVPIVDPDPTILSISRDTTPTEIIVHKHRRSCSPRRYHSPLERTRRFSRPSRSPITSPLRLPRPKMPSSSRGRYSRSPSPSPRRRKSPRKSPIGRREKSPRRSSHDSPETSHDLYAPFLSKSIRRGATLSPSRISTQRDKKSDQTSDDGEDNVEHLRKLALSTKQQKNEKNDLTNESKGKKKSGNSKHHSIEPDHLSDNDHEDLELRMIALKSAVLKKHQKRVKRNLRKNPFNPSREMSPLGVEDDLDSQSGEQSADSCGTQDQAQDMELDSNIENESDYELNAPTNQVMSDLLEDHLCNASAIKMQATVDEEAPYSPTDPTRTPYVDRFKKEISKIDEIFILDSDSADEAPYSPSDTLVYDPKLQDYSLEFLETACNETALDLSRKDKGPNSPQTHKMPQVTLKIEPAENLDVVPMMIEDNRKKNAINLEKHDQEATEAEQKMVEIFKKNTESTKNPENKNTTQIGEETSTIPENCQLPENVDKSVENPPISANLTISSENVAGQSSERCVITLPMNFPNNSLEKLTLRALELTGEPLYLRGIPGVTKEPNKVPTLINKTLVPASILKSNKNLQQLLSQKKVDSSVEPSFKSAQMLPVEDEPMTNKNTIFKPIKLQSVSKKPVILLPSPEFNSSFMEETDKSTGNDNTESNMTEKIPEDEETDVTDVAFSQVLLEEAVSDKEPSSPVVKTLSRQKKRKVEKKIQVKKTSENELEKSVSTSKTLETSPNVQNINEETEKNHNEGLSNINAKRRHSIEEDEETLREILLASLAKRSKIAECTHKSSEVNPPSLEAKKSELGNILSPKTSKISQKNSQIDQQIQKVITNEVSNLESADPTSLITQTSSQATLNMSKIVCKSQYALSPVEKSSPMSDSLVGLQAPENSTIFEAKKRLNSLPIKGPPRKIMKSIPVSTKVVNNAKKFQNTMLQKKLTQTKLISTSRNLVLNNVKPAEPLASSRLMVAGKIQRLVINLGEDSDTDSENSGYNARNETGTRAVLSIPTTDFEKSVDQFLKEQRKKQEMIAASINPVNDSTPNSRLKSRVKSNVGFGATPLAVRHLPPSQQEEYKRLKQQILEKERQRANKQIVNNTSPSPLSPASPVAVKSTKFTSFPENLSTLTKDITTIPSESKGIFTAAQIIQRPPPKLITTKNSTVEATKIMSINEQAFVIGNNLSSDAPQVIENLCVQIPNDNLSSGIRIVGKKLEHFEKLLKKTGQNPQQTLQKSVEKILQKSSEKCLEQNTQKEVEKIHTQTSETILEKSLGKCAEKSPEISLNNSLENSEQKISETIEKTVQKTSLKTLPAIFKILSSNDLNMKLARVHLKKGKNETFITNHDQSMGDLLSSIDDCDNSPENIDVDENVSVMADKSNANDMTVDSQASTVILPPREDVIAERSQNESGDTTIILNDTIEERNPQVSTSLLKVKSKSPIKEHSERIKSDLKAEMENFALLSEKEQKKRLKDVEENLVKKRYLILDDLTDMSSTLKQWDIERELQTNLIAEVRRLKIQLAMAEERLQEQRMKIDGIAPKVTKAHETIIEGRAECLKLTKLCQGIGNKVVGQEYKVPSIAAQMMMERLKEVACHTRQLSKKKVPCEPNNSPEDSSSADECSSVREKTISLESVSSDKEQSGENISHRKSEVSDDTCGVLISRLNQPKILNLSSAAESRSTDENSGVSREKQHLMSHYESVFTNVRTPRHIDLHRELCPFELSGICKDVDCRYNHLDETRKQ